MEYQKIINLLDKTLEMVDDLVPKFSTKKWIGVHDQSGNANDRYKLNKQIRFKSFMLQSDLQSSSNVLLLLKQQ